MASNNEIVFGRHPVVEMLKVSRLTNKILLAKGIHGKEVEDIKSLARKAKVPFFWVERRRINKLCPGENHQGVVAFSAPRAYANLKEIITPPLKDKVLCILDQIMDPGNLGAIIRTGVAFGINGIILASRRSSPITASAVKASAGAVEWMPVVRVSNTIRTLEKLKELGFWSVGADPQGVQRIEKFVFPKPLVLVMGNEKAGLRPLVKKRCDYLVQIPISNYVDSLNLSLASGIFFYEVFRQKVFKNIPQRM